MPNHKYPKKPLLASGAAIFASGVAIAGSLALSSTATATPNSVKADMRVVSIGSPVAGESYLCPIDNGSTLTYRVVYQNVADDQAYQARVTFTTGSNQALSVSYVGASFTPTSAPVCHVWTAPNGYSRVAYCDVESWNTAGATMTFDFTVTTTSDDLNVAASVSSLISDGDGQGVSLMANNYLEHPWNPGC